MAYEFQFFFLCQNEECQAEFMQTKTSIKEKHADTCPVCKHKDVESIIYDPMLVSIRGDINEVAQLAEKNSKLMGKYGVEDRERAIKQQRDNGKEQRRRALEAQLPSNMKLLPNQEHKPWYGKLEKKIDLTDQSKVDKYIATGE